MTRKKWALGVSGCFFWSSILLAHALDPGAAPGKNFDLSSYRLQTFDRKLQVLQVQSIDSYQDPFFFTDPVTGEMIFRVPSGAGHTAHSKYPRVELRQISSWFMTMNPSKPHVQTVKLRVVNEPARGGLIFAQIHGEETGGSEALKLRWRQGTIEVGFKEHYGDEESRTVMLKGLSLGDTITCRITVLNADLTVEVESGTASSKKTLHYDLPSWRDIPLYFKVGVYSQDDQADSSYSSAAVLELTNSH
ncbi:polysaccharide lyase family 7 protein [Pseudomonas vanderleydeniana]|uniref:Polysaccharide lyase family 7 protein n=1 Tax=Pseudomonas vanderleydeniana TaxID=2745495 RepID=A0A9E6PHC8_9PSED|nr:polysaccharide lyase family 7 protein [Pseudomonas vanderleydeniana]QXI26108.1 polysaccharide lyase family 7 protein [Pseudomonas vanderleydeniana]